MIHRIDLATDVSTIGVWDAGTPPDHLGKLSYKKYRAAIEERARKADVFFIDMHSDGSYDAAIYVDEEPDAEWLSKHYRRIPKTFRIRIASGSLVAGGLEDYTNPKPQITTSDSRFTLGAGLYQIGVFQDRYTYEEMLDQISAIVSPGELAYHESRPTGCGPSALVMLVAAGLYFWVGILPVLIGVALSAALIVHFHRRSSRDTRVQRVQQELDRWEKEHPLFILIFQPDDSGAGSDGFFSVEEQW